MEDNQEHIDLFDRYTTGQLSAVERRHFEDRLRSDADFASEFREYLLVTGAIQHAGRQSMKDHLKSVAAGISADQIEPYTPSTGRDRTRKEKNWQIMQWVMIIGSIILMVAFVIALFNLPDLEEKLKPKRTPNISSESEIQDEDCQLMTPLPISALGSKVMDTLRLDSSYARHDAKALYQVCQVAVDEEPYMYLIRNEFGDSLIINSMNCEELALYTPVKGKGLIVLCDSALYLVTDKKWEPYESGHKPKPRRPRDTQPEPSDEGDEEEIKDPSVSHAGSNTWEPGEGQHHEGGIKPEDVVYTVESMKVEKPAGFPGGEAALQKYFKDKIRYPSRALDNGIEGTVYVSFVVNEDGSLSAPRILKGIGGGCDREALRLVRNMPDWTPAQSNGECVKTKYTLPIKFALH